MRRNAIAMAHPSSPVMSRGVLLIESAAEFGCNHKAEVLARARARVTFVHFE
jgi:hypothetical protein